MAELLTSGGGDGSTGFVLFSASETILALGVSEATGDINGDGIGDIAVSVGFDGRVNLLFGRASSPFPAEFDIDGLLLANGGNGSEGFTIFDDSFFPVRFGEAINGIDDLNDDGVDDLAIGHPEAGPSGAGLVYILYGRNGGFDAEIISSEFFTPSAGSEPVGFVFNGVSSSSVNSIGRPIARAGDVNADGIADIIIGDPAAIPRWGSDRQGRAYVVFGRAFVDTDNDGISDFLDNCLAFENAMQLDSDQDGIGNRCDADINQDCTVNVLDLAYLRSVFFTSDAVADFNADGVVNIQDLGIMRELFFMTPGPSALPNECTNL